MSQPSLSLSTPGTAIVECLGQTFASEAARREHFAALLAAKLKDPEFRKIEGFPIGKDEDILALSDPPYYTACPNPWMGDFLKAHGTPYDPKKPYHREPFAADVSEGKNHPIYGAHSYHTKVPHRAIMRYILHFTEPGDVVFDGFCGTGMTGVAAQLCGDRRELQELGYRVDDIGSIFDAGGRKISEIGSRRAILNDLAPSASFISFNYNMPVDVAIFQQEAGKILESLENELGWMYQTKHLDGSLYPIDYMVWSEVYNCPECAGEVIFLDEAMDKITKAVRASFPCPHCNAILTKNRMLRASETYFDPILEVSLQRAKRKPALVAYKIGKRRIERALNAFDQDILNRIDSMAPPAGGPLSEFPFDDMWEAPRMKNRGVSHVHHLFLNRTWHMLSRLWSLVRNIKDLRMRSFLTFWIDQSLAGFSILNRYTPTHFSHVNQYMSGVYYIPAHIAECSPNYNLLNKVGRLGKAFSFLSSSDNFIQSTGSLTCFEGEPETVDYIFLDPPFGDNFAYSELNYVVEAWLRVVTNSKREAIVDRGKKNKEKQKDLQDYLALMRACFQEAYRLLKPGRWLTVEFSNTKSAVWNSIQTALAEAGFVVANVSMLDKQQGSFKAITTTTAVVQDLVISAYKPNGGLEDRFAKRGETEEGAWDFVKTHLRNLPVVKARGGQLEVIPERDPRILYDRMVAFYVGHSTLVPLNSAEFQVGLAARFPQRDEMFFLPEQVNEYDRKRSQMQDVGQMSIFVEDEKSAIAWLRNELKDKPRTQQDIHPDFLQQLNASWKKWETRPELRALLDQNFLRYDGEGEVPSQIHSYLSTQFKELRNLAKDDRLLRNKAKDRWFVPDPKKNIDVEKLRNKRLLEEFWTYLPAGYSPPALNPNRGESLPGMTVPVPKVPKGKKLKELRSEAVRVGFKHCYQQKDYQTILVVAEMLPESVIQEDEALQMYYDTAVTRTGGD